MSQVAAGSVFLAAVASLLADKASVTTKDSEKRLNQPLFFVVILLATNLQDLNCRVSKGEMEERIAPLY